MSALVVTLTALGAISYIAGAVIVLRLVHRAARTAACDPAQELHLNRRVSARTSCVLALSAAALGFAFSAKDLVRGDVTWQYMAGLELGLPMLAALGWYAANRWIYFPHMVFGLRAKARGAMPAGGWYDYELACTRCGGSSDDLRAQIAATEAKFTWECRRCGNVNVVEPAAPCLTSASS